MIGWLKRLAENENFRSLHEKIEAQRKQIESLERSKAKVLEHIDYKDGTAACQLEIARNNISKLQKKLNAVNSDHGVVIANLKEKIKEANLAAQHENHAKKMKIHIQSQRQNRIVKDLKALVGDEEFFKITTQVNSLPDDVFL